ncbi:nitroreductase family protein [Paenarthrobacter nitroguajacolicus]|uniref:nitroreductase family protein n=1 Tax=Paenarthrobacter nitroguajacolicus TaxID=211146 RepID=UPI000B0A2991|nr:nitroreductase family protein [Paenarthrobacter nitroguajacolicus]
MAILKRVIKSFVPAPVFVLLKQNYRKLLVIREAAIDASRHIKYGAAEDDLFSGSGTSRHLECQLTKDYHRIEKGLALKHPKHPFGEGVRSRLELGLRRPIAHEQLPEVVGHAESALEALEGWNTREVIPQMVSPTVRSQSVWEPILNADAQGVLEHFFSSRRSVRAFDTSKAVDHDAIRQAASTALSTPSVCNRQAWRLHVFTQAEDVSRVIRHQNGNAGFGGGVPALAVVTVDTRLFAGAAERHQRWIDGGLFAMNFAHGLHAQGLATCMLNWSMKNDASNRLRESAGIPAHEDIVMLVAIGHTENEFRVARSPRRSLDAVLEMR